MRKLVQEMSDAARWAVRSAPDLASTRNELLFELAIALACGLLGLALSTKILVSIAAVFFAVAVPDLLTGVAILRRDPDRTHAIANFCFYLALGITRALAVLFAIVLFGGWLIDRFGLAGWQPVFRSGVLHTGILFVLAASTIFPLVAVGAYAGLRSNGPVYFAAGLTRYRRNPTRFERQGRTLEPFHGLGMLAWSSAGSILFLFWMVPACAFFIRYPEADGTVFLVLLVVVFAGSISWFYWFCRRLIEPWSVLLEET
jgi:hypothetical protein